MTQSRIEIPIPQPEPDDDRPPEFKFIQRVDGLVECRADTIQDHIAAFRNVTEELDDHYWAQAAVAASASKKYGNSEYGKKKMEQLAEAVELSPNYLYRMARTYRTFTENFPRERKLYFKHHVIACGYANPSKALSAAVASGMTCGALEDWVSEQNKKKAKKITRKAQQAAQTDFLQHLEHVESVIEADFIKNCPIKDFARRVYEKGWLSEIKFELRQFNRQLNIDLIRGAIDEDGARTLQEIKEVTTLAMSDIESIVGQLVATNEYEWVKKGGKPDEARGDRGIILHKVDTPVGT
jgi:pyruvoyl-dependent arginine decarboxylase (PvlArgDC)